MASRMFKKVGDKVENKLFGGKKGEDGDGTKERNPRKISTSSGRQAQRNTKLLLHGTLQIEIKAAQNLPDTDNGILNLAKRLNRDPNYYDVTDPFVTGTLGSNRIFMTSVKQNKLNPEWNENFIIPVCHVAEKLVIEVKDKDDYSEEPVGSVSIPIKALMRGEIDGWHDLTDKKCKTAGQLNFVARFTDVSSEEKQYTIDSYFPARNDCHVDLYSCARNSDTPVTLCNGKSYQPGSCYLDMYKTILRAEKFIYITGWSVWTDLRLVRDTDLEGLDVLEKANATLSLGELLIMKAKSGVKVAIMIWSDITSNKLNEKGIAGTHDETTFNVFKDSPVQCRLVPREVYKEKEKSDIVNHLMASASYTHHQKTIIADTPPIEEDPRRTITAYVGGLDLTDGRYDTPEHPIFKSLLGVHKDDFYQGCAPGITKNIGPRQPWQDIHARVTGKIAADVFINFKERWYKQGQAGAGFQALYKCGEDLSDKEFNLHGKRSNWTVQLLRSISEDSAAFADSKKHYTLTMKKNTVYEESIMKSYVAAIRSAEKYIYIENQYFLGSAYAWETENKTNCHHCIPAEIAEKVASKIRKGEEFAAYIVIPLHPEGNPKEAPFQEILAWERRTVKMMYRRVGDALKEVGSSKHPTDYLMFFCLVKKEKEDDIPDGLSVPPSNSMAAKLRKSRRFMIYVHSKLMIVDDSVAIVGSANINQRSLGGSRDTEIAVSCHQPQHTIQSNPEGRLPKGEMANFRMRIFQEHLGPIDIDTPLREPHTAACVQLVKETCQTNWKSYFEEDSSGRCGHLVEYPIQVDATGDVTPKPECVNFPDTTAKIEGGISSMIPEKLTT